MPLLAMRMHHGRGFVKALCVTGFLLSGPAVALGDGALPDSETILVPADRPQEIVLVTNFGLVISEDVGRTWLWSCEQQANGLALFYQMGLPPRHRLHAVAGKEGIYSDDGACTWSSASGQVVGHDVVDLWVDRAVADRLWAVTIRCCDQNNQIIYEVFESTNGGVTFDVERYVGAPSSTITGVETARSDPRAVYLTATALADTVGVLPSPEVIRSTDSGMTWTTKDLTSQVGQGALRLLGVDVQQPGTIYLLWAGGGKIALVVSKDGGDTASKALITDGAFKSFVQMSNGTLLVSSDLNGSTPLYRSRDRGTTFESVPDPPHVRGLAQRDGVLYAATDNFTDGFAVEASSDEGTTWTGLMEYSQIKAIVPCLKFACQDTCSVEVGLGLWTDDVCSADAPLADTPDAAAGTGGASGGGSAGASGPTTDARPGEKPSAAGGCACGAMPFARETSVAFGVLAVALAIGSALVRRPRGRNPGVREPEGRTGGSA